MKKNRRIVLRRRLLRTGVLMVVAIAVLAVHQILTRQLESQLAKRRILEIYLNIAELGPGIYGAEAASRTYFGRSSFELDRTEAAQLAASLSRPSRWNPHSSSKGYQRRVATILRRLQRAQWLKRVI